MLSTPTGPSQDRLARARCLVPLLTHVAVRLSSLAPALGLLREGKSATRQHRVCGVWPDASDGDEPQRQVSRAELTLAKSEAELAAEEILLSVEAISRLAFELAELCCAEGHWLAILALAPRVIQKFAGDFEKLATELENFSTLLSSHRSSEVATESVALQPAARVASGFAQQEEVCWSLPLSVSFYFFKLCRRMSVPLFNL